MRHQAQRLVRGCIRWKKTSGQKLRHSTGEDLTPGIIRRGVNMLSELDPSSIHVLVGEDPGKPCKFLFSQRKGSSFSSPLPSASSCKSIKSARVRLLRWWWAHCPSQKCHQPQGGFGRCAWRAAGIFLMAHWCLHSVSGATASRPGYRLPSCRASSATRRIPWFFKRKERSELTANWSIVRKRHLLRRPRRLGRHLKSRSPRDRWPHAASAGSGHQLVASAADTSPARALSSS